MSDAFICDATRTAIGRYAGALASVRADDLAAAPIKALIERQPNADWEALDDVILGCANQAGEDNRNVARMAALLAGLPLGVPGSTVNRLCGSGLDAVGSAARAVRSGDAQFLIAGGVESMTRAPFVIGKADAAFSRAMETFDTTIGWRFVNPEMQRLHGTETMPETAENVAAEFGISREDQDRFACHSQRKCEVATANGFFAAEITPFVTRSKSGEVRFEVDEHPRPGTTLEALARLKAPFRQGGSVTAGNSSGVNDGAAALLIASEAAAARHGFAPRARIVAMTCAGVPPRIMGIGPWPATEKLLAKTGVSLSQIDLFEFNEAFASQALAVVRKLGLEDDDPRINPHGGAIAIGHPLGCSGARLALTAVNGLERLGGRYAVVSMCIGVGQGIAMLIERI